MRMSTDSHALRILFDTYWSPAGWKRRPYETPPEDLAYAIQSGYMFPSQKLSHDEAVARARRAVQAISMQKVGDVFLASLTTRRLEWRSALGNYAVAKQLPDHTFMGDEKWCQVCYAYKEQEADWNVLNFERYKWGGVRHDHVAYAAFDLEQLSLWEI